MTRTKRTRASSSLNKEYNQEPTSSSNGAETNSQLKKKNEKRKRKTRGKSMCKIPWHLPPDKRIKVGFNIKDQPIGREAIDLATGCGVVARMGNFCSLKEDNWKRVVTPMKDMILNYMRERFIFPEDKEIYVLLSIGQKWRCYKCRLRKKIYKYAKKKKYSIAKIARKVPDGVEENQWVDFVKRSLSEAGIAASKKGRKSRSQQKEFHMLGAKSIACKRNEMEIERGCPVGDVKFYLITHSKKNGGMNDAARDVVDKCKDEIAQRTGNNNVDLNDNIELQTQVIRDVRGPKHPGHIRGEGMGPTPSMIFGRRSRVISDDVQQLEAQVAKLMQRDVEQEADYMRLKKLVVIRDR